MTQEELRHLEALPSPHNKFWVPCMWFVNLALRARTEGRINNDVALTAILAVSLRSGPTTTSFPLFIFLNFYFEMFTLPALLSHLGSGVEQFADKVHEAVRL